MADELHALVARKVRERVKLRLQKNSLELAQLGWDVPLNSGEADQVADVVVEVLAELNTPTWTPPLRHGNRNPINVYAQRADGSREVHVATARTEQDAARLITYVNENASGPGGSIRVPRWVVDALTGPSTIFERGRAERELKAALEKRGTDHG